MNTNKYDREILDKFLYEKQTTLKMGLFPLEPIELCHLVMDWLNIFPNIKIVSIFKIKDEYKKNYQYFVLDSDLDIQEYIMEKHYFSMNIEDNIKDKIVGLFKCTEEIKFDKEIIDKVYYTLFKEK